MRKILFGFMGLLATAGVLSGTAYALFTDTVQINNVAIGAGSADLEFSVDGVNWVDDFTFQDELVDSVYPGFSDEATFFVRNTADSSVSLDLSGRLVSASGDWGSFANVALVEINGVEKTLANWNADVVDLNMTLEPNDEGEEVTIKLTIPEDADNGISGKNVSTSWQLYGQQSTEIES